MITDAAVARALGDALGHSAPFSADELATLRGPVVVRGARKLEGLGDCTALEELTLLGCALEDTAVIGRMSNLRRLHVLCSTMDDVAPLAVPPLELLELNFSVVRDATPLLASRSLRVLRAYGVPWDVESYDITLYEWRLGDHGEPAPAIELSRTSEWLVCRALFEAGVEACLATLPGRWTALVRPGIHAGQDYCEGYPEQMVPALAKATPTSWSDATATGFRTTSLADAPVDRFRVEWESGTDADARRWVASASLDDGDAAALERFIGRFSDATFWREPAAMQAVEEKRLSTRIPSRLARLRSDVLAGI